MTTALPRCTGNCAQGRRACNCPTGQPIPAEACTELGAGTAPARPGLLARLRIAAARWQLACLTAEREHYQGLGWVGPIYLRESYTQQRRLMARIRQLQDPPVPAAVPSWRRTAGTALVAITGAAGLVLAACGGGGTDEEPQPRPQVDCNKTPEQCR